LENAAPHLAALLGGSIMVGHNVGVDYRLLHRCLPDLRPAALIDTLALARHLHPGRRSGNSLTSLLDRYELTGTVTDLAPASRPHRAIWDTLGAAVLLTTLIHQLADDGSLTLGALHAIAGRPLHDEPARAAPTTGLDATLF
jgi:DNA polymerase-3 subunit epsilon/exodeoxyribonuclease X